MFKTFKSSIQVLLGIALAVQLTGCFYGGHDDRWHHDHDRHYDHPDPGVNVNIHG